MKFIYQCTSCNKTYQITAKICLCRDCQSRQLVNQPLYGVLDLTLCGKSSKESISPDFDIFDLLPVEKEYFPPIPVGNTPLWAPKNLRTKLQLPNLFIKDEGSNPTGSLKDRASYLVSAMAKKYGIDKITLASTGNAASSMAGVGAAAGIDVTIFLPKNVPKEKMVQSLQYGAQVYLVDGNYDQAYELSLEYGKKAGGISRNTAYNPLTIEGKKTVSLEIYKQLGNDIPGYIFVPTGDGVILSGVYKGFKDLIELGVINRMPEIYSVQAQGSDALYRAYKNEGRFEARPTSTVADSICVDVPRAGFHALNNLKKFNGRCIRVSDEEILGAQHQLAKESGLFSEPAAAAAFAGLLSVVDSIEKDSKIVVLSTGNGLKDISSAQKMAPLPVAGIKR